VNLISRGKYDDRYNVNAIYFYSSCYNWLLACNSNMVISKVVPMISCEICGIYTYLQAHHKFSNTKLNRKLYGKLLDHEKNIMFLCQSCHTNEKALKFTEREFCEALGIEIRSKSGLL